MTKSTSTDKIFKETTTGENLAINYPATWIISKNEISLNPSREDSNQKVIITSPDGNVKITFWTGIEGIGGTCSYDPDTYLIKT